MTQTLDVGEGFSQLDSSRATGAPTSATQTKASKFGTFAITFGIAFPLLYTAFERLNWPLFTYHPVLGNVDFWRQPAGVGPPMFWYGWIVLAAISAFVVGGIATIIPGQWLRRATVFCCALAALWPAALAALRIFIVDWATFDAEFLNSVWVAAVPAFVGAAVITYYVPSRLAERVWTSWLLIAPIGGLVVLGYSLLQPWFLR
ncbi:MAG TPA: hypothetical protein VNO18_07045 [Xanthobacteraceae bacterium]|jgi:hypothetical protein|nr:hypothetical protein [Xanthobacteraceae bacterium]